MNEGLVPLGVTPEYADESLETRIVDESHRNIKILVVDDEPVNVQVLENHLSLADYTVFKAQHGDEALAILEKEEINLILLDIMMPRLSGYEVCKIVRRKHSSETYLL